MKGSCRDRGIEEALTSKLGASAMLVRLLIGFSLTGAAFLFDPVTVASRAAPKSPANLGFEEGEVGSAPPHWEAVSAAGIQVRAEVVASQDCIEGRQCAKITASGSSRDEGSFVQTVAAARYWGKRLRVRATLRSHGAVGARASFFVEVDRRGRPPLHAEAPPLLAEWRRDENVVDVPKEAEAIHIGLYIAGPVEAWIDTVTVEEIGDAGIGEEPPRPLTERGRGNLMALLHLVGLVRYFHPSDQAVHLDWDRFVIGLVDEVEGAGAARDLIEILSRHLAPVAPTVQFFVTGESPPPFRAVLGPGARPVAWRHFGLQTSAPGSAWNFVSRRVGGFEPFTPGEVVKGIEVATLQGPGSLVRFQTFARTILARGAGAEVLLRALGGRGETLVELRQQVAGKEWRRYRLQLKLPPGAIAVWAGGRLLAPGTLLLDDARIESQGTQGTSLVDEDGFETGDPGRPPVGWFRPAATRAEGFTAEVVAKVAHRGNRCLKFSGTEVHDLPDPQSPFVADLGAGVSAAIPLAVFADHDGTLPNLKSLVAVVSRKLAGWEPCGEDRTTRLADVILLGSALERFFPDPRRAQMLVTSALPSALDRAAMSADGMTFLDDLRQILPVLSDGHAVVTYARDRTRWFRIPIGWSWIEDQLVVTAPSTGGGMLRPGDVILSVDGKKAKDALAHAERRVSGATVGFIRVRALDLLAECEKGAVRQLEVQRSGEPAFVTGLSCTEPVFGGETTGRRHRQKVDEVQPGIFYLDLDRIDDQDYLGALKALLSAKGLIFDLRGYPARISPPLWVGHILGRPAWEREAVTIHTRPDRESDQVDRNEVGIPPVRPRLSAPVVVLTDNRAMSRAEAILDLVASNNLVRVVGSETAGTRGEIDELLLPGGYAVYWTGSWGLDRAGEPYRGVHPYMTVTPTIAGLAAGRDEVLDAALDLLRRAPWSR